MQSHNWVRLRIHQMEPDVYQIGNSLEEALELRREHAELCTKLNVSD